MPSDMRKLNKEMFDDYLYYDPSSKTGLRWKVETGNGRIKVNTEAGSLSTHSSYFVVKLKGKSYPNHRVIAVINGIDVENLVVDHIDRNKQNNEISNLRAVSSLINCQNKSTNVNNKSGVRGVCWNKEGYWIAFWSIGEKQYKKRFIVKDYSSKEEAFLAAVNYRKQMEDLHYGEIQLIKKDILF